MIMVLYSINWETDASDSKFRLGLPGGSRRTGRPVSGLILVREHDTYCIMSSSRWWSFDIILIFIHINYISYMIDGGLYGTCISIVLVLQLQ